MAAQHAEDMPKVPGLVVAVPSTACIGVGIMAVVFGAVWTGRKMTFVG